MKYVLLLVIFPFGILQAQKKKEFFVFNLPEQKVASSLYNTIEFRDLRTDTSSLGVVQVGAVNTRAQVVPKEPLQQQFQTLLTSVIDKDAKPGKLLLTFRLFNFIERNMGMKETGFFFVRADLYDHTNEDYRLISTLDTIVQFNAVDVTQKLLRKGENLVAGFIIKNLTSTPSLERSYSLYEAIKIDSIQKAVLPVYNRKEFVRGVYPTFESFRDQQPTITEFSTIDENHRLKDVFIPINSTGGLQELKPEDYFAVVHEGVAYVATKDGYFPLKKRGDDFFYGGFVKSFTVGPAATYGAIGIMLMSTKRGTGRFRMDHINGSFLYEGE